MGRNDIIRAEIAKRNIPFLVHFTREENLSGILQHGLLSVRDILERGVPAVGNGDGRLDGGDSPVSLSIATCDFRMFAAKRKRCPSAQWVLLLLYPDILWKLECRFYACNASSTEARYMSHRAGSTTAFLDLFRDVEEPLRGGNLASRRQYRQIPPFLPTDPASEVQVLGTVPTLFICGAVVEEPGLADRVGEQFRQILKRDLPVAAGPFREILSRLNGGAAIEEKRRAREIWDAVAVGEDHEPGYLGDGVWYGPPEGP
ncbi:DUF4433 domain-containing protein [Cereibacter sphaeroides]|uniref:DarT ssDNA thymidine ADP-ribosyltransferase family protein n=1 Tax=Cereibacter sphaeroides TaxID=1063 RepID=UPI001F30835F|nr:DarT ssDNA thymidine ADP-ribosyltransferase family protein [Cereibacter sphaeroides]MCE6958081.1 DUF4433 domain-containing protein [Cereibacter sphaeroides]MCE6971432.1 DUF4433 domain-containing protein [Cereibacter sphaeroides]